MIGGLVNTNRSEIQQQMDWMAKCGGTLEGYRAKYGKVTGDAIYWADTDRLDLLRGTPASVIERRQALRILGEEYFA